MLARRAVASSTNVDSNSNGVGSTSTSNKFIAKEPRLIANNPESINVLVLETDEAHPETLHRRGSIGEIFHDLFMQAGSQDEPPLAVNTAMRYVVDDPYNDKHGHVPSASEIPEDIHAILITGSVHDAYRNEVWVVQLLDLLKDLWMTRPDILFGGVCFGHQILSRLLGATVEPTPGGRWELAHTKMNLTPVGQKLFRTDNNEIFLHQMHLDQVTTIPSSKTTNLIEKDQKAHVWASTEHTKVQGLYIRDRIFTSQGHLGLDEKMVYRLIEKRQNAGTITDEKCVAKAKATAHMSHDGVVVAGAMLRFFYRVDVDVD